MRFLEICCGSVADVIAAKYGGARRVELCSATELGGLTPSAGLIVGAIREKGDMKVHVLIRPCAGGFIYSPEQVSVMEADIAAAREAGADGVVIGALTEQGELDLPVIRRLIAQAKGMSVTFHRAFDECKNPYKAIEQLAELGIDRLLTSGQAPDAPRGIELIKSLVEAAAGKFIVMPGAGITPANIAMIEQATEAKEFHSTATDKQAERSSSPLFGQRAAATSTAIVRSLVETPPLSPR